MFETRDQLIRQRDRAESEYFSYRKMYREAEANIEMLQVELTNKDNQKEAEKAAALAVQAYKLNAEFRETLGKAEDKIAELRRENADAIEKDNKKMRDELVEAQKKLAVAEAQNKLLESALQTNEDILDVKNIIGDLIKALPSVKLDGGISINAHTHGTVTKTK